MKIGDLEINIHDNFGLYDLHEIISELKKFHENFDTHAMSDHANTLRGQKQMLGDIIKYLERILGAGY